MINIKTALSYDDVLLIPQYSDIESRKTVDLSCNLGKNNFNLPIISSPMNTVSEDQMALSMHSVGGLTIIHRYNTVKELDEILTTIYQGNINTIVGIAVGVKDYMERIKLAVSEYQIPIICVDIAHGHHILAERAIKEILNYCGDRIFLIAGNVATKEGFDFLAKCGSNGIRCGIGGGSICETRINTGHGIPTLQTILDCNESEYASNVSIIADGGCRNAGDCVKALAAGADFILVGNLLSGTKECPGEIIKTKNGYFKRYQGMASLSAQRQNKKSYSEEGVSTLVPYRDTVIDILKSLEENIKSGLSYSGAKNIKQLQSKAKFIRQTQAGYFESIPHILRNL